MENNSEMTWTADLPGAYTLVLTDAKGVYAKMSATFILSSDILPVVWDADLGELATAEGFDEALKDAFIKNLSIVTVNGKEYAASGRGAAVIINNIGELDTEAAVTSGKGKDATVTPIFPESGTYEIIVTATGFDMPLTFTTDIQK